MFGKSENKASLIEEKYILAFSQMKFTWQLVHHQSSLSMRVTLSSFLKGPCRVGRAKDGLCPKYLLQLNVSWKMRCYSVWPSIRYLCRNKASVTVHEHTRVFSDSGRMQCRLGECIRANIRKPGERSLVFLEQ